MRRQNILLALLITILIAGNIIVSRMGKIGSSYSFDSQLFTVSDTAAITGVTFSGKSGEVVLEKTGSGWTVNQSYSADEDIRRLLFSILRRVEVRRPADIQPQERTIVTVKGVGELEFEVSGNATRTRTYFTKDGESYEVEIPGYRDYLGSIFELTKNQWRNREVVDATWRTIQKLRLDYTDGRSGFSIDFKDRFFEVGSLAAIDSNRVVEYLNLFEQFQVNELIELKDFPKYEEIAASQPVAILTIESLNYSTSFELKFYPIADGDRIGLVSTKSGDWGVIDRRRIAEILVESEYFSYHD